MRIILVANSHPSKHIGGAQYQTWLLSKGLVERGHSVTFLAARAGTHDSYIDDAGVPVIEIPGWLSVGSTQHYESVAQIIAKEQPDLIYVRSFQEISFLAKVCKENNIPFVSTSVSAMETSPFLSGYHPTTAIGNIRSKRAIWHLRSFYAIRDSAAHVCNLRGLQTKIEKWYPKKPLTTIYNGSPVPDIKDETKNPSGQVIWVNNIKRLKRPEVYIDLARRLPDYRFVMVGGMPTGRYGNTMSRMLEEATPNLDYLGKKPVEETNSIIRGSDLLLYTSLPIEGFANSFLQAWFREVPTISYSFELDGLIEKEGLGRYADNFEELVRSVDELMSDDVTRQQMGIHAREFAEKEFAVDRMVEEYVDLFSGILNKHG